MAKSRERIWCWVGSWVVLALLALLVWGGFQDGVGRNPNEHAGPVPASVERLRDDAYLIVDPPQAPAVPRLCGGGEDQGHGTRKRLRRPAGTQYVHCHVRQTWNVSGPPSTDYSTALLVVATDWKYVSSMLLLLLVPLALLIRDYRSSLRQERARVVARALEDRRQAEVDERNQAERAATRAAAEERERLVTAEVKRSELCAAYARGDLTDRDFERGLARVHEHLPRSALTVEEVRRERQVVEGSFGETLTRPRPAP